jgi:hypothetical protein
MVDMIFDRPVGQAMGAGLRVPSARFGDDPATRMGLGSMQATDADAAVAGRSPMPTEADALSSMDAVTARRLETLATAPPIAAPGGRAPRPPATVYYNQLTNEMFAGDRAFKADDVRAALEVAQQPTNTLRPEGQGWTALPEGSFEQYLGSFSERRGTGELLGRGLRNVAYGFGTLPGTVASLAGFEETGAALRAPVEELLGDSENDRLRSALIAESSSLWNQVVDASIESIPYLLTSVAGGLGGAALAGRGAGMTATAVQAAKQRGAMLGATGANLPIHLAGMYDAAVRNNADLTDLQTKAEILGGALANTALDWFGIESRLFSPAAKGVFERAARNAITRRLASGAVVGLQEATTEVLQTAIESMTFDPVVRESLSTGDLKTLARHTGENYLEPFAVAGLAGGLLGGAVGVAVPGQVFNRPPEQKREIDPKKPVDLSDEAAKQAAEKVQGPLALPAPPQEPALPAIGNIPGAATIGALAMPPQPGQITLRPEERAGARSLLDPRTAPTVQGEVLPPEAAPMAPGAARLRALPAPPQQAAAPMLPPPPQGEADFTAGPRGVAPRGYQPPPRKRPPLLTPGQPTPLLTAQELEPAPAAQGVATGRPMAGLGEALTAKRQRAAEAADRKAQAEIEQVFAQRIARQAQRLRRAQDADALQEAAEAWDATVDAEGLGARGAYFESLPPNVQRYWADVYDRGDTEYLSTTDYFDRIVARLQRSVAAEPEIIPTDLPAANAANQQLLRRQELQQELQAQRTAGAPTPPPAAPAAPASAPVAPPVALPEGVFGAKDGRPFKSEVAANGQKPNVAKRENVPVGALAAEQVPGGWGLRYTPPTGPDKDRKAAKLREPKPKPKTEIAPKAEAPGKQDLKPRSEAAPQEEAGTGTQAPARPKSDLAERVEALDEPQLFRLQQLLDFAGEPDIDAAIANEPGKVETALRVMAGRKPPAMKTQAQRDAEATEKVASLTGARQDTIAFGRMISEFNQSPSTITDKWKKEFVRLAASVRKNNPDAPLGLGRMLDYVNPDNTPNILTWPGGKRQIAPVGSTIERAPGRNALADWNTIDGVVDLSGKPVLPLPSGRVDLLVRNYLRKLKRPPTITVARNQADLKAKNPELYRKAKAARGKDDFDTANALGYSFGDGQVVIFSDRVGSEAQLNFVLAHESLGHYGLRAIMPAGQFSAVMEQVYKSDPLIAMTVDRAVEARGMSRAEATEEYLADYAAVLDMSLLRRATAAIKTALNAVGFRFSDDMVRHLLRTSRRYVRNGKRDNLFTTSDIFQDIQTIESGVDQLDTGRFKTGFASDNIRTDMVSLDVYGHIPRTAQDINDAIKPLTEKLSTATEQAVRKFFSLTVFNAMDNPGLSRLVQIVQRGSEISMRIRNAADEIMGAALDREVRFFGVRVMGGITETDQLAASRLNYGQQDDIRGKVDEKVEATVKALREAKISPRMYTLDGDTVKDNTDAIDAYTKAGRLTIPEAKELLAKDKRYEKIAEELNKDHEVWKAYTAGREAFEYAELEFVKAQYEALKEDRDNAMLTMLDLLPDPPGDADKALPDYAPAMFKTWTDLYFALYSENATTVEDNLIPTERSAKLAEEFNATVNEAIIAKGFDAAKETAIRKFFKGKEADDFIAQVVEFRKLVVVNDDNKFVVQNKVSNFGAAELSYSSAEISARKMLVQGYTPINRRQEGYQIRAQAYDPETGELLQMHDDSRNRAVYRTVGTRAEGTQLAARMEEVFSDTDQLPEGATDVVIKTVPGKDGKPTKVRAYKMLTRKAGESEFREREVVVRFDVSAAATEVSTPLNLNLNEFIRGLRQYGLAIHPSKLEQIVVDMTAQDARARKRLEQTGNPGYEVDGGITAFEALARHIDGRASLTAKIQMRPKLDKLMNTKLSESRKLWFGDKKRLDELEAAYKEAVQDGASEQVVHLAKREYDRYATQMRKTQTVTNGRPVNMGNKYLSEGHSLLTFINGNQDVNETDWGSGPVASFVRRWVVAAQLGGSLAQPIMNNVGPFTNFIPWLGSVNAKTGFGGGAGFTNAYSQYLRAMSDVGGGAGVSFTKRAMEMHTGEYWNKVATGLESHEGVKVHEAEFIAKETLNGILTPAQANNLLGHARNYTTNPAVRKALDKWMFFYLSSEQATRRSAALAAFRVEWDRQLAREGVLEKDLKPADYKRIHKAATDFAIQGVILTLGDYNAPNRPAAWRSGFQSFLYMYRVWPTTTIQTFSRLSLGGKAAMAIPLIALSGLAGLPFAEDGEDLVDTILQRSGSPVASVRLEAARLIDEVFPGASPFILNGVMSNLLGADVAGRFSVGDFVPGSALFLPGQDPYQSFKEAAGPAWGFFEGVAKGGTQLAAAPFSDTATFVDAMREGPITLLRALGDAAAYTTTGAAIDKRGYVIVPEATTGMLVTRVMGFAPAPVAAQYELIRLAKRETNYQKQVVAKLRTGLLKAELAGDRETAASIRRTVREWNQETRGTLLEIRNFEKNYQRLKKKATMPAKERFLQSAGKANQEAVELIGELVMYD